LQRYALLTGTAVADFDFYLCFGLFRRAAIEQQKLYRFLTGQTHDTRYAKLDEAVRILLESCRRLIAK
jgi:aminoglycoside phosphotransferase (APT) family kinase protein